MRPALRWRRARLPRGEAPELHRGPDACLGVAAADIEELAHDVFVIAHQKWATFDSSSPVRPWLFGIAVKVASGAYQRAWRKREVPSATYPETEDKQPLPDAQAEREQMRRKLMRALDTLDLERRAIFVLHDRRGHPRAEEAPALCMRMARPPFAEDSPDEQPVRRTREALGSHRGGAHPQVLREVHLLQRLG